MHQAERMTLTRNRFVVRPIDPDIVTQLLERDDAGRSPRIVVDDEGGSPLRCCLRVSRPGEQIALVSYAPLRRWARARHVDPGAYDEVGPIFVHTEPCAGAIDHEYPSEFRGSKRMLRAYSCDGRILGATFVEANGAFDQALDEMLSDPDVAVVHARAVEFGCFTFEVRRPRALDQSKS